MNILVGKSKLSCSVEEKKVVPLYFKKGGNDQKNDEPLSPTKSKRLSTFYYCCRYRTIEIEHQVEKGEQ